MNTPINFPEFVQERNSALLSLDREKILAYCRKYHDHNYQRYTNGRKQGPKAIRKDIKHSLFLLFFRHFINTIKPALAFG